MQHMNASLWIVHPLSDVCGLVKRGLQKDEMRTRNLCAAPSISCTTYAPKKFLTDERITSQIYGNLQHKIAAFKKAREEVGGPNNSHAGGLL